MCGRFAQYSELAVLESAFQIHEITCDVTPSYNIAPLQKVLTIIRRGANRLGRLHWGLVPSWASDTDRALKLINARVETVAVKPVFRNAFKLRRCLIPADGFFEWKTQGRLKQPWYFTLASGGPFAFAGLWGTWKGNGDAVYHSCTIITTVAAKTVQPIHHRMPVILSPKVHAAWLDPENRDVGQLREILSDGCEGELKRVAVSLRVNSARYNDPGCIEPVDRH